LQLSTQRAYTPAPDDVGYALRFECAPAESSSGADVGAVSTLALAQRCVAAPLAPPRRLVPLVPDSRDRSGRFTVLTYNVLSDIYASVRAARARALGAPLTPPQGDLYSYCPPWALSWSYRRQNLLRELLGYNADVLCLQEIQSNHFEDFFLPELQRAGYHAVYKRKTGEMFTGSAYAFDGCATFFRKDCFALIKKYEVEFNKAAGPVAEQAGGGAVREKAVQRLMKNNVALILVLEALEGGRAAPAGSAGKRPLLCVANTHIHANPELNDVKLWQVHTLLKGLEKIAASAEIPMVVCGDFNSVPRSAAHSLLSTGRVDPGHPELATDPLGILRPPSKLSHSLQLSSVYAAAARQGTHMGGDGALPDGGAGVQALRGRLDCGGRGVVGTGEPFFTNCTRDFTGTLDYIFYTRDALVPTALLELPAEESARGLLGAMGGLPSPVQSSDHIAIMAELSVLQRR